MTVELMPLFTCGSVGFLLGFFAGRVHHHHRSGGLR